MEKCPHVEKLTVSKDLSLLDPSKWLCSICGTTEWVWACLSCAHVACGRLNEKHAVSHYEATKHHIAIEINEKYVYCYTCDEYIMEDNSYGDLEAIRSALTAIGTMSFEGVGRKGGNLLRSFSHQQEISYSHTDEDDRIITAQIHYRKSVMDKVFTAWADYAQKSKKEKKMKKKKAAVPNDIGHSEPPPMVTRSRSGLFQFKKRTLIPGVTGLRNLGNTCYINSIIQSLGHLEDFREYFCQLVFDLFSPTSTPLATNSSFSPAKGPLAAARQLLRLNTVDYYQHLNTVPVKKSPGASKGKKGGGKGGGGGRGRRRSSAGGLNGGRADPGEVGGVDGPMATNEAQVMKAKADALDALSLCQELHGLLRVLWSGKWAQVSPHGFLHSVWRAIPAFKGHAQHDAQEFLCELLDKLSREIEDLPQCKGSDNIVDHSFRGELVSQVTCLSCKNTSRRYEPFLDLSLEFPPLFQQTNCNSLRKMCHLSEMLYKFTEQEELEPKSYSCEKCNTKRKRSSRQGLGVKTDASKQLLISKPPEILRLHLKRFRWCGRNHREKINTHVAFDDVVDISPFCLDTGLHIPQYRLQAVVVHHGAGFRAGHYTAYTYNNDAGSWVHCNDSRVNLVSEEEVLLSQAYILFYTRELTPVGLDDMPTLSPESSMSLAKHSTVSTIPALEASSMQTIRRLSRGETEQIIDDDISISFHRDPTLIQRLTSVQSESDLKRTATLDLTTSPAAGSSSSSSRKPVKRLSYEEKTRSSSSKRVLTSSCSDSDLKKLKKSATLSLRSEYSPTRSNDEIQLSRRLSSLSPDSGMKRATPSPPCLNKFMKLNSKIGKEKSDSPQPTLVNNEATIIYPEPSRKILQSLRTTNATRQSHSVTDLKTETTLQTSPQSSLSSSAKIQTLTPDKTNSSPQQHTKIPSLCLSSQSEITKSVTTPEKADTIRQRLSPIRLDLKKEATLDLSSEKLSPLSKIVQNVTPEKVSGRSPKQEPIITCSDASEEPSIVFSHKSSSPSRLTAKGSPEKASTRLDAPKDTSKCLDSQNSSPGKLIEKRTPEKVKTSPQRQCCSPRVDFHSSHSPPPSKVIKISSPKNVNISPKRQISNREGALRKETTFDLIVKSPSSPKKSIQSNSATLETVNSSPQKQPSIWSTPSPSKMIKSRTPEKANTNTNTDINSSPKRHISIHSDLKREVSPDHSSRSHSSSPSTRKMIKMGTPEKQIK